MGSYVCDICVWCACVYMYACHDVWIYECGMNVVCVWYTYMFVYFVCFYFAQKHVVGPFSSHTSYRQEMGSPGSLSIQTHRDGPAK